MGALSVHLIGGIFGTLAVGILGEKAGWHQFKIQLIGVFSVAAFILPFTALLWGVLKKTIGIRVSEEKEYYGLDVGEHGMESYPDFEKVS